MTTSPHQRRRLRRGNAGRHFLAILRFHVRDHLAQGKSAQAARTAALIDFTEPLPF